MTPEERAALVAEANELRGMLARQERLKLHQARVDAGEYSTPVDPTKGMSRMDKFGAGMASGALQLAKGAGNMMGLVSDEDALAQKQQDEAIGNTGWGTAGQMVSQGIMTAPVGGAWGTAGKALGKGLALGSKALPRAVGALGKAGGYATSLPARAAVEGAVTGAITADPNERGAGSLEGAAWGAGMGVGGKVGGRVVSGLAKPSAAADDIATIGRQNDKNLFLPLSQAVDDESADLVSKGVKYLYKDALPYIPGVSAQLRAQESKLSRDFREISLKEADRWNVLTPDELKRPEEAVAALKRKVNDEFKTTVKAYDFPIPTKSQIGMWSTARIKQKFPGVDEVTLNRVNRLITKQFERYSDDWKTGKLSGENLMEARNRFTDSVIPTLKGREKHVAIEAGRMFDDIVVDRLSLSGVKQHADDLARYKDTLKAHAEVAAVTKAVGKAAPTRGEFTPSQLVRSAGKAKDLRDVGQSFHTAMKGPVGIPSAAGRWAGRAATIGGGLASLPMAVGGLVGANALASKTGQRAMMGQTDLQRLIQDALRKRPDVFNAVGTGLRASAVGQQTME